MTDKVAGVEFAGLENDRLENDGLENDGRSIWPSVRVSAVMIITRAINVSENDSQL